MEFLDIFTFLVLAVLVGAAIFLIIVLGALPGKIAKQRQHRQMAAINICGWIGILTMGLFWPIALIWAYTNPLVSNVEGTKENTLSALAEKIQSLEKTVAQLQAKEKGNPS